MRSWFRRFRRKPSLEQQVFALLDKGDFLGASNLLRDAPARGGVGNAYYEYVDRWRQARRPL